MNKRRTAPTRTRKVKENAKKTIAKKEKVMMEKIIAKGKEESFHLALLGS